MNDCASFVKLLKQGGWSDQSVPSILAFFEKIIFVAIEWGFLVYINMRSFQTLDYSKILSSFPWKIFLLLGILYALFFFFFRIFVLYFEDQTEPFTSQSRQFSISDPQQCGLSLAMNLFITRLIHREWHLIPQYNFLLRLILTYHPLYRRSKKRPLWAFQKKR